MASASVNTQASSRESSNYSRLCRLLVDMGCQVLRETFDKIHPPESLHVKLSSHPVRARLELLYKGKHKILNSTQWGQLFPSNPSSLSSRDFDISLLMVLLRNISSLNPPTSGWEKPPPATDTSIGADITRLWVFRNEINDHACKAHVDDLTFEEYWKDIQQTLTRLGGEHYGPHIDKLKADYMDPDIAHQFQERLRQWREDEVITDQIEGDVGCINDFKTWSKHRLERAALKSFRPLLLWLKTKARGCARDAAYGTNRSINSHDLSAKNGVNRIMSRPCHNQETRTANEAVVAWLDQAINLHQSDHIAGARKKLQGVFQTVRNLGQRFFCNPTKDGLIVLHRGKELFLEDSVNCSVKHGTLLLDSSNSGAQFYSSLLNVIGAFAVVISEFKVAKEAFSLLIDFHQQSAETSRKRDLGAAYNNKGCISLILGELKQAELDFKTSLKYLESAKERHQLPNPLLETMSIAVNSNIGRLYQLSRSYSKALEKQEQLVESCKAKEVKELPLQVVFTVLNNLSVLCTTLGKFSKAEQELKWLVSYCYKMNREDCDFLLNFVALHLSEVFLIRGKQKEAEEAFRLDDDIAMLAGLHINVRIETVEKLVDVFVLNGKIRSACELLERSVNIIENIFGSDHFNVALLLYKQGEVLTLAGEILNAAKKFKRATGILEEIFGIKHPLLLKCYISLGELALRSKRADESYFYYQRAMENIETIYQVSFVNQLSRTYLEMTSSNTFHQSKMLRDRSKIEGLVAEHGVVLAVLLSRPVVQDNIPPLRRSKAKLKQHLCRNDSNGQCPDSKEIFSFKYTNDLLQTGQTFLRQGMKKEAAAFFRKARKYSMALDATRGPVYACVARLYDVLTMTRLGNRQTLKSTHEMSSCLEELTEVSIKIGTDNTCKRPTEEATTAMSTVATEIATATIDDQLNLKLVLIFLILLSIEQKMMNTTFAAYDLYCRISQNEDGFLHVFNGEVQIYASKTSITCNGKTALQNVLVSTGGFNENDTQRPLPDKELYRSLAFKKNVPTDSFLVAYTSSVFLDIEELKALDGKISLSVQECFQEKCFETDVEDSATQVVVDLTTTTSKGDHRNVLLTGSRMELLSLCLSQAATSEESQHGNISEISTAMHLKTVCLTFEDEHTSHYMFRQNARFLYEQFNSSKISTLSFEHQCLSLTITHPVKARLTLWRKDRSISQKVQFVETGTRHGMSDWKVPRRFSGEFVEDFGVPEGLSGPAIDYLKNKYHSVAFKTDVAYDDYGLDVHCEQNGQQPKEKKDVSLWTAQSQTPRDNFNASMLEALTDVSKLPSEHQGDVIQEGDDEFVAETHRLEINRAPTSSQSQLEQEVNSSDSYHQSSTFNPKANTQSQNFITTQPLAGEEMKPETRETFPMPREEEDDNLLGRSLFEKDRDSRRSLIVDLQQEITRKSNLMNEEDGPSDEVRHLVGNSMIEPQNAGKCHTTSSPNHLTRMDISNNSFMNGTSELPTLNLMEPQSKIDPRDDEEALGRDLLENDQQSTEAPTAKLKGPEIDEVLLTWNDKRHINKESAEDHGMYKNEQFEDTPFSGQRVTKGSFLGTTTHDSIIHNTAENAALGNQHRSNYRSSIHDQTQHYRDVTGRQTTHAIIEEEKDETISPMEIGKEYVFQPKDERESHDGHNEPMVNKDFYQDFTNGNLTRREKTRSSCYVYDDTVIDGSFGTSNGIHNTSTDVVASRNTDAVDGPLRIVENSFQIQSGLASGNADRMLTSRRQTVDETNSEELQRGTRRKEKLPASQKNRKNTSIRNPQFAFLGGNILTDGTATDSLCAEGKMVNGPVLSGTNVNLTEKEKSPSSFNVNDDTVPDGPFESSNGIHHTLTDLIASRNTNAVDEPLKIVGNSFQIQSGLVSENADRMLTSWKQTVEETNCQELERGTGRNEKLPASQKSRKDKSFRNPFLEGNLLVDGGAKDSLRKEDKTTNAPVLTGEALMTCQDETEKICGNEMSPFPSDAAKDEVDSSVYFPKSDANVRDLAGFGGARPKQILRNSTRRNSSTKTKIMEPITTCQHNETGEFGLEPDFLARHTVRSNGAILDLHPQDGSDELYFSARAFKDITHGESLRLPGEGINLPGYAPSSSSQGLYAQEGFAARTSKRGDAQALAIHQKPLLNQKESWHFPFLESPILQRNFSGDQSLCASQQSASQSGNSIISNALFGSRGTGGAYDETDSMLNEYHHMGNVDNRLVKSPAVSDGHLSSAQDSMSSLLGSLQQIMSKTVNLIASSNAVAKQPKEAVKLSIQEEARGSREKEQAIRVAEESAQGNEETEGQPIPTPVQETPRPVCSHYQRRCLVRFPCCGKFYPCHRCHNESKECSDVPARATNATHMRCSICYHEQEIDEQSQNCSGCKSKMSDYFCATCKHFTSVEKNPFHCDKCGICRIHRDRSFHCDVCNVCLDKRLQGKHKCRPDSGHDECCICLEDAFSGCQILPCSHKVHKDCAILMIQNGVRKCPICRHPLFSQPQNSPQ